MEAVHRALFLLIYKVYGNLSCVSTQNRGGVALHFVCVCHVSMHFMAFVDLGP